MKVRRIFSNKGKVLMVSVIGGMGGLCFILGAPLSLTLIISIGAYLVIKGIIAFALYSDYTGNTKGWSRPENDWLTFRERCWYHYVTYIRDNTDGHFGTFEQFIGALERVIETSGASGVGIDHEVGVFDTRGLEARGVNVADRV